MAQSPKKAPDAVIDAVVRECWDAEGREADAGKVRAKLIEKGVFKKEGGRFSPERYKVVSYERCQKAIERVRERRERERMVAKCRERDQLAEQLAASRDSGSLRRLAPCDLR